MQKILKNKYIILNDLHKLITCLFFRLLRFRLRFGYIWYSANFVLLYMKNEYVLFSTKINKILMMQI